MESVYFTLFTATFNRAYCLETLYESLVCQNDKNFEWLIVDDGSTDNTDNIIKGFIEQNKINIKFIKQNNKGKHAAINNGLDNACGDCFMIIDSDDKLPSNALEIIKTKFDSIINQKNIAGVVGRKSYFSNKLVGSEFNFQDIISNGLDIRFKHNLQGDLAEVFKTKILKKFPFPEFENEKFCPEALVWNRIAQHYKLLYFNQSIYECEYLVDGLTAKIVKIRMESPRTSMLYYAELEKYKIPFLQKWKANSNFWRFSFNSNLPFFSKVKEVSFFNSLIGFPFGFLMFTQDKRKV